MSRTNRNTAGGTSSPLLLPLLITAALLLSGCAAQSSSQQEPRQPTEAQTRGSQTAASGGDREAKVFRGELGPPTLGDPGAPVVMVEYGDFQ